MPTTRKELSERALEFPDGGKDMRAFALRTTSGTTGSVPVVRISKAIRYDNPSYAPLRRFVVGLGPISMRVSNAISIFYNYNSANLPRKVLCLDVSDLTPELGRLLAEFDPECVRATTSFLFAALERADARALPHLSLVAISGERIPLEKRAIVAELFPCAKIVSSYASTDVGSIGEMVCGYLPPNTYHPVEGVTVEIENPDEQGAGEILVSNAKVERYRVGDRIRLLSQPCPCGAPVSFEVLGRADYDQIKIAGAMLRIEEFERVARELAPYVADYRATAEEKLDGVRIRGVLAMRVIPTPALLAQERPEEFIAAQFSRRLFVTPTQTLEQVTQGGAFLPIAVELAEHFPVEYKTLKLRFAGTEGAR